ncbi:acid phosphatase 1-like isoform X1 [Papaver somniferum]|uniref:acid phosphatase 1-like isoform X1 n=1 Tax=Papaver somniferum TaxID=3469 RepID=UPI000E7038D7|nr:acid phosphatase 1-like isoform X1 [Papaver somniferum]
MERFSLFILLATLFSATYCHSSSVERHGGLPLPIHLLRPNSGFGGELPKGLSCNSWRLAVETNNLRYWKTVPAECENYVGHYMLGLHYRQDSKYVTLEAAKYAKSIKLTGDGKDIWVFDIDETSLSDLPYYATHGFGAKPYNSTAFNAWVDTGKAPALPETLKLYKHLKALGFKVVYITGREENRRDITRKNLHAVGYKNWEKLLLKQPSDSKKTATMFKSEKRAMLVKQGYRIWGNIGDQWSDILGTDIGGKTFKLPDPMYYIS